MNFKLGILNALPRLGVREGHLARALGITFLNGSVPKVRFHPRHAPVFSRANER